MNKPKALQLFETFVIDCKDLRDRGIDRDPEAAITSLSSVSEAADETLISLGAEGMLKKLPEPQLFPGRIGITQDLMDSVIAAICERVSGVLRGYEKDTLSSLLVLLATLSVSSKDAIAILGGYRDDS